MDRVIIIAAGDGRRWGEYRGTPKHLVKVENEVLLERTCRQFLKYTSDVNVIGLDRRYAIEGTTLYVPGPVNTNWKDANKIMVTQRLWSPHSRTVLVFGDVYFTNDAVKTIMSNKDDFKFFLRRGPSALSGARWKEIFALSFQPHMQNNITQTMLLLISYNQVERQATWALYKKMIGQSFGDDFANHHHVSIDDWTEDFDFPEDLEIWETHRKLARKARKKSSSDGEQKIA